ncbi:MAG: energy-coupling factor transporter transmembrane protein EcfT [Firmicutes bacterium]|nr:energy-coupling factor transporter transmembrane protein EcfT [Bacillota bacterium]MDH7496580.1 energy-coupling factor transporter transmembrane component T [Bacillota bacterium]
MLGNVTIGQYIPGDSPVHNVDPRVKILITLVAITALFMVQTMEGYGLMLLLILGTVLLARLPVRYVLRGVRPLAFILVLTFGLHLFMNEGRVLFRMGPLVATYEGAFRGFAMSMRLVLLVLATSILTLSTSPIQLTDGIESLLSPARVLGIPAHELAMMMTIALRFIPTLLEETDKIMKAQMARGADFETGNVLQRAKNLVPLLVPLFVSAFRRADELAMAMEARCYKGGQGRTRMKQLHIGMKDVLAAVGSSAVLVAVAVYL